jgi:hydroxymethylbilane synthase
LARLQALQVGAALENLNPNIKIEYSFHESLGDKNQNDPLWQMPEKGVFTQDLREGLLARRYDLAVHSWKDLAIEDDGQTEIVATLPRADMRDLLLVRTDRWEQVRQSRRMTLLTSSPRRSYNLESFLPAALPAQIHDLVFEAVRGNVPTRIRKMWNPGADGLIVAKAAIDRLLEARQAEFAATKAELRRLLSHCRWMVLPLGANPTAAAQGALAIEIRSGRPEMRELLASINCPDAFETTMREREILRSYGGGCHQKIGTSVLRRSYGEITFLRGLTDGGIVLNDARLTSNRRRPPRIAKELMWPFTPRDSDWFKREPVPGAVPNSALWVAKADALPEDAVISDSQFVWTAGSKTWLKLSRRGVWVNGSADGLGEQEDPRIETLAGGAVNWSKLTHTDAPNENGIQALATYRLVPNAAAPNITGRKYFFWSSGSAFERALSINPWLKSMTHFCGPGNTQKALERNAVEAHVFLSHEQWLREMATS